MKKGARPARSLKSPRNDVVDLTRTRTRKQRKVSKAKKSMIDLTRNRKKAPIVEVIDLT